MIELVPPEEPSVPRPLSLEALPTLSDEALDALPFGVIALDETGVILRYNLAEARLARLDRSNVLGRSFFRSVAPCTRTPEFEGRVRAFLAPGATEPRATFPYLFDFKFGAQEVEVELIRPDVPALVYLAINRRRFVPARAGLPDGFAAPRQAELEPSEATQGVTRDAREQRVVQVEPTFFAALRHTWDRVAPRGWPLFSQEWGHTWGRLATIDLEVAVIEETEQTLRQRPIAEVVRRLSDWLRTQGWGKLIADFGAVRGGTFVLELERNALAESVGASELPRCQMFAGLLGAYFTHVANRLLVVREVSCRAQGGERCVFVAIGHERRAQLDAAISAHRRDVPRVLAALRKAPA